MYDYRLLTDKLYQVRITIRGNKLDYNKDIKLPVINLSEIKILLNSTISDTKKWEYFACINIKDYFLTTLMKTRIHEDTTQIYATRY